MSYVVYINPWRKEGRDLKEPYARVHTTRCGEWTEGKGEYPGGYWLGPFKRFMRAVEEAEEREHKVITCNFAQKLNLGMELGRMPGPKARDLYRKKWSHDTLYFTFREIYAHPQVDVILQNDDSGEILELHSYLILRGRLKRV